MKKILLMLLAVAAIAVSCDKDDNSSGIVGEWSGVSELDRKDDIRIHMEFNADGSFKMSMPAWGEYRVGKYTVAGDKLEITITGLGWLWDKTEDGYLNVYDAYGVKDFNEFMVKWSDEINYTLSYEIDKDGCLHFTSGDIFGLELIYFRNPGYIPEIIVIR